MRLTFCSDRAERSSMTMKRPKVAGDRPKSGDATDVVHEVFDYRTGQAEAWAKWKKTILTFPTDPEAALYQFFAAANALPPHTDEPTYTTGPLDYVQNGRNMVERGISHTAKMVEEKLDDHEWDI